MKSIEYRSGGKRREREGEREREQNEPILSRGLYDIYTCSDPKSSSFLGLVV